MSTLGQRPSVVRPMSGCLQRDHGPCQSVREGILAHSSAHIRVYANRSQPTAGCTGRGPPLLWAPWLDQISRVKAKLHGNSIDTPLCPLAPACGLASGEPHDYVNPGFTNSASIGQVPCGSCFCCSQPPTKSAMNHLREVGMCCFPSHCSCPGITENPKFMCQFHITGTA